MESMGVGPWIAIVVVVGVVGVLLGYLLGTKLGGHNTEPMRKLNTEHKEYKDDVREHFEQVSMTMSRMVEDYREMYHHVSQGAEKLADMHHETVITPPPKPEAITQQPSETDEPDARRADETADTDHKADDKTSRAEGDKTPESEEEASLFPDTRSLREQAVGGRTTSTPPHETSSMSRQRSDSADSTSRTNAHESRTPSPWESAAEEGMQAREASQSGSGKNSEGKNQRTSSVGAALDDDKQAAGSQKPSDVERPQDAAIRAAAEDAANKR